MALRSFIKLAACFAMVTGCGDGSGQPEEPPAVDGPLPEALPFELTRAAVGDPLTPTEVQTFTREVTGFWKRVDYFRWCSWHSHGLDASYNPEMPDYKLWWQDTLAVKQGDTITFRHIGGADNIMIRTPKVLTQTIAGYMASGDPVMGKLLIDYAKGIVALFQGMVWASEDPWIESITARAIFTHNHSYVTEDGRRIAVDYDSAKQEKYDWNAHTVPNTENPYFGSIWVRNMRSKDDVPHMFRVVPLLMRVVQDAPDDEVREAAEVAVSYLRAFANDIVDHGYTIRTKENGVAYVPTEDLASFVTWEVLVPNAECNAKLTSALLGQRDALGNDCDRGINPGYEAPAGGIHYFNWAIIRYFHLAAITNALVLSKNDVAQRLLDGLIERCDLMMVDEEGRQEHLEWDADVASYLLAAGASGLPLTARDARLIQQQYSAAVTHYDPWPHWDLWDPSVPDGEYEYKPSRNGVDVSHIRPEEMAYLMEYCYSPWRNPASIDPVDCAIVLDPQRWGE